MKIISWNVNGIRAAYKKDLPGFISKQKPDIFCLQETKAHPDQVEPELRTFGQYESAWSSATKKGYSGTATFWNSKASPKIVSRGIDIPKYDSEGRFVISDHEKFKLFNIYFPNGGSGDERHNFKQEFLKDLLSYLEVLLKKGERLIITGDYNIAHAEMDVHDPKRLSKESGFLPEERAWLDSFFALGFVDCFRHFHKGEKDRYSWWSYREMARVNNRGWRIDYFSVSPNLVSEMKNCDILDEQEGSDHCPLILELDIK